MVLEEAAAGFLYSLKKHKRSLRSKAGQLATRFLGGLRGASLEPAAVPVVGHLCPGCGSSVRS